MNEEFNILTLFPRGESTVFIAVIIIFALFTVGFKKNSFIKNGKWLLFGCFLVFGATTLVGFDEFGDNSFSLQYYAFALVLGGVGVNAISHWLLHGEYDKVTNTTLITMTYRGYAARIEYDNEDGISVGHIVRVRDNVGFHADTVGDLRAAFREAVDDYIETCTKVGKEPQKAYSGQVMFRVDSEVHHRAAVAAELAGKSLNQWAADVFAQAAK